MKLKPPPKVTKKERLKLSDAVISGLTAKIMLGNSDACVLARNGLLVLMPMSPLTTQ